MNRGPTVDRRAAGDAGITLVEVLVSMAIMSIVMAVFTAGVLQMFGAANRSEAVATAQSQLNLAFLRLDREIRYASAISTPGPIGDDSYVEYLSNSTGVATCYQLRLHDATSQLQHRTWVRPATPGGWIPLASDITSAQPFELIPPSNELNFQQLRVRLVATSGQGGSRSTSDTDVRFTALNTSLTPASGDICQEGRTP